MDMMRCKISSSLHVTQTKNTVALTPYEKAEITKTAHRVLRLKRSRYWFHIHLHAVILTVNIVSTNNTHGWAIIYCYTCNLQLYDSTQLLTRTFVTNFAQTEAENENRTTIKRVCYKNAGIPRRTWLCLSDSDREVQAALFPPRLCLCRGSQQLGIWDWHDCTALRCVGHQSKVSLQNQVPSAKRANQMDHHTKKVLMWCTKILYKMVLVKFNFFFVTMIKQKANNKFHFPDVPSLTAVLPLSH